MNVTNMRELRTRLRSRKNSVGFNMGTWFKHNSMTWTSYSKVLETVSEHPCGTVACLGGHSAILAWQEGATKPDPGYLGVNDIYVAARKFLGLTCEQADELFYGRWSPKYGVTPMEDISKASAIKELTRLIDAEEGKPCG